MNKGKTIAVVIAVIVIIMVIAVAVQTLFFWDMMVPPECPEGQVLSEGRCVPLSSGIPQPSIPSSGTSPPEVPF